jgi:hypothetical protein
VVQAVKMEAEPAEEMSNDKSEAFVPQQEDQAEPKSELLIDAQSKLAGQVKAQAGRALPKKRDKKL